VVAAEVDSSHYDVVQKVSFKPTLQSSVGLRVAMPTCLSGACFSDVNVCRVSSAVDEVVIVILGNGEIDFDEFILLVERCSKPVSSDQEMRDMFNAIDKDHSGFVDADELKETFVALGIPLTDSDVRGMMKDAGVEGCRIYYEGTVTTWTRSLAHQQQVYELCLPAAVMFHRFANSSLRRRIFKTKFG